MGLQSEKNQMNIYQSGDTNRANVVAFQTIDFGRECAEI